MNRKLLAVAYAVWIVGNWLGARCFERVGVRVVKPVMLALLAICFVKVAGELLGWL